ncbi:MAG: ABC transporter substrate-binding protein [Chloroflexi bacterium]|nr:ABC transporter substrate-binding protein [Chloroflexota bacterium]
MIPTERRARLVSLLLLFSLLTTQCGAEEQPAKPAVVQSATVRWATWDLNSQVEQILVKQFRETYPQIEFKRESVNAGLDYYLGKPPAPDILNMDAGYELNVAIQKNQVADLTEIWTQTGLLDTVPASIQKLSVRDGKQYYLPIGFGWEAIYYNKQIFAQYNLTPPKTWQEFLTVCATLQSHGETPLAISGSEYTGNYWFEYLDLRLNGAEFHRNLLAGKESYTDAKLRRVMETWKNLFDQGYFIEGRMAIGDLYAMTALIRGDKGMMHQAKAVMVLSDTYSFGQLPLPFQAELGFFSFPVMDASIPTTEVVDPFGYIVPLGAEHIPAALAFLTHISSVEAQGLMAQNEMVQAARFAPARTDIAADRLTPTQQQAIDMVKRADDAVMPFYYTVPREMSGMVEYTFRHFINEPKEIDEFLQKFEETRQQLLKKGSLGQE